MAIESITPIGGCGLMAGLPQKQLCPVLNFELMDLWQKLGGGWARVARYRNDLDGVGYVLKSRVYASEAEQNYEMQKFGSQHCQLILSDSVWRTPHRARLDGLRATFGRNGGKSGRAPALR